MFQSGARIILSGIHNIIKSNQNKKQLSKKKNKASVSVPIKQGDRNRRIIIVALSGCRLLVVKHQEWQSTA